MDLSMFVQTVANSTVASAIYASVAVGLALCFGVMQMANFAHGEFFMLGAYVVYVLYALAGLPYPLAVLAAMLIVGFIGLLVERFIFHPTRGNVLAGFMATAGLAFILQVLVGQIWGVGLMRNIPTPYMGAATILGAQIGSLLGTRLNAVLTLPRRRVVLGVALLIITVRVLFGLLA